LGGAHSPPNPDRRALRLVIWHRLVRRPARGALLCAPVSAAAGVPDG